MTDKHDQKENQPDERILPFQLELPRTAIVVIDTQNAFLSANGYFDQIGIDLSRLREIIPTCQKILNLGRETNIKIIYVTMGAVRNQVKDMTAKSPRYFKSSAHHLYSENKEYRETMYIDGTWGAEIIDELKPHEDDIVLTKYTHDGFVGTNLNDILKQSDIRYLVFIGLATNICIESTLRHAYFLDFFNILISDSVTQKGPPILQESTLINVQSTFGWVMNSAELVRLISSQIV